jgi:hypothetical protein
MTDRTYTTSDGVFNLNAWSSADCATIAVDDDREIGARYASTTAKPDSGKAIVVEVSPR